MSVNRFHPFARSPYLPTLTRFCLLAPVTDCVALDTALQALEPDVRSLGEEEQEEASRRLEAALEDVMAILAGAQEDARALLGDDA